MVSLCEQLSMNVRGEEPMKFSVDIHYFIRLFVCTQVSKVPKLSAVKSEIHPRIFGHFGDSFRVRFLRFLENLKNVEKDNVNQLLFGPLSPRWSSN